MCRWSPPLGFGISTASSGSSPSGLASSRVSRSCMPVSTATSPPARPSAAARRPWSRRAARSARARAVGRRMRVAPPRLGLIAPRVGPLERIPLRPGREPATSRPSGVRHITTPVPRVHSRRTGCRAGPGRPGPTQVIAAGIVGAGRGKGVEVGHRHRAIAAVDGPQKADQPVAAGRGDLGPIGGRQPRQVRGRCRPHRRSMLRAAKCDPLGGSSVVGRHQVRETRIPLVLKGVGDHHHPPPT